ncbi:MAG: polysaccharide biosynthesis C-terminal domain-containing protein [Psychroflexus sp.]|nr:polysaccharide biosynthesis C-terminal domain-containing protein [Psychroflexus sp.]
MGIVSNQSFKNVISTYAGFAVGALNVLVLYPYFLSQEYYGLVTFLLSAANLIWPFLAVGFHNVIIRFYSTYKTKADKDTFLTFALIVPLISGTIIGLVSWWLYDWILVYFSDKNQLIQPFAWLIVPLGVLNAYFEMFYSWVKVFLKSVFGNLMKEIFHRLAITMLLGFLYFDWIKIEHFIYYLAAVYMLRVLVIGTYALWVYLPKFQLRLLPNYKSVLSYASLILLAGFIAVALFDLDKVMIEYFMPVENVPVYGIAVYIAAVIAVPVKAMNQIAKPLTASFINEDKLDALENLYQRSSITLLIISGFIFLLIVCNLDQIYAIIPEEYRGGYSIVIWIGLIKVFDNLLGNGGSILYYSDYYKVTLIGGLIIVALAIAFNALLIPLYGILGAGITTFLAFLLYDLLKLILVYKRFKITPFSVKTFYVIILLSSLYLLFAYWHFGFHPLLDIVFKSLIISTLFIFLVMRLELSDDLTALVRSFRKK